MLNITLKKLFVKFVGMNVKSEPMSVNLTCSKQIMTK